MSAGFTSCILFNLFFSKCNKEKVDRWRLCPSSSPPLNTPGAACRKQKSTGSLPKPNMNQIWSLKETERYILVQKRVLSGVLGGGALDTTTHPPHPLTPLSPPTPAFLPCRVHFVRIYWYTKRLKQSNLDWILELPLSAKKEIAQCILWIFFLKVKDFFFF